MNHWQMESKKVVEMSENAYRQRYQYTHVLQRFDLDSQSTFNQEILNRQGPPYFRANSQTKQKANYIKHIMMNHPGDTNK